MLTTIWIIQIITAVVLILLVLGHSPKSGIGLIGDSAEVFASQKSAEKGFNHFTYIISAIFLICSFLAGYHFFR